MTIFYPQYNYKKYENIHFIFEYKEYYFSISLRYSFVLSCTIYCSVMYYFVQLLLFCESKRNRATLFCFFTLFFSVNQISSIRNCIDTFFLLPLLHRQQLSNINKILSILNKSESFYIFHSFHSYT
jgi:hypothetical protein